MPSANLLIKSARIIIWDFDGVIKESVQVKTDAFAELFAGFGDKVAERVVGHHRSHGGVSRYEKIPLYLAWAGEATDQATVESYCQRFSALAVEAVIESAWVPGVRDYLLSNPNRQRFALITATPRDEMISILTALELNEVFGSVFGAPLPKCEAVAQALAQENVPAGDAVMVGDSMTDLRAAEGNSVPFVLRRTAENAALPLSHHDLALDDFKGLN